MGINIMQEQAGSGVAGAVLDGAASPAFKSAPIAGAGGWPPAVRRATFWLARAVLPALLLGMAGPASADDPSEQGEMTQPAVADALTGRSWHLVQIMSMDDSTDAPADRSRYTLTFDADGGVQIRADCNRGMGTWESPQPGQLTFGDIAATRAQCPPGSLHDRYLAQFPWVRSYVMRDGNLFLATMADGAIIEFEQAASVATVLGDEVRTADADEVQQTILTRLFDRYAEQEGIEATDAEVDAYVDATRRGMRARGLTAEDELTPEEAAEVAQMRRDMGRAMIRQWKLNKSLYERYGGRIIFQQLGPEPLDAYRRYLEERQAAGDFRIHDEAMADAFWRYFTDDSRHSFYPPGSEEEAQALRTPPWEQSEPNG